MDLVTKATEELLGQQASQTELKSRDLQKQLRLKEQALDLEVAVSKMCLTLTAERHKRTSLQA